jgi:hypothetical protein
MVCHYMLHDITIQKKKKEDKIQSYITTYGLSLHVTWHHHSKKKKKKDKHT